MSRVPLESVICRAVRALLEGAEKMRAANRRGIREPHLSEPLESRVLLTTPVVQSIARTTPTAQYTTSTSVAYTVTFNTAVNGVDTADFQLLDTVALGQSGPVLVSGSGATRTVTVNGIHGNGTLQLNLVDNDSITSADTATERNTPHAEFLRAITVSSATWAEAS